MVEEVERVALLAQRANSTLLRTMSPCENSSPFGGECITHDIVA